MISKTIKYFVNEMGLIIVAPWPQTYDSKRIKKRQWSLVEACCVNGSQSLRQFAAEASEVRGGRLCIFHNLSVSEMLQGLLPNSYNTCTFTTEQTQKLLFL